MIFHDRNINNEQTQNCNQSDTVCKLIVDIWQLLNGAEQDMKNSVQIKEGVIHRGRRPRWITPSEICRILHILGKPKSIISLLFIRNISQFLKEFRHLAHQK